MKTTRPPPPPPPPSNTRFGVYRLIDRIAVGGMAEVFQALEPKQVGDARTVVVKRMLPSLAMDPRARAMFEEEARLADRIRHPNVVRVLCYGEEGGQPFIVLELVRGLDLWRFTRFLTRAGRELDVPIVVYITLELLAGLQAVHQACDANGEPLNIVHRDVSPSNILLSVHGEVKLGDFGIARARAREAFPNSPLGEQTKGKLGYLAPEQISGLPYDQRADIFAVGVIAAELLMGRPLFAGGSELAILLAIRDAQIHPFTEFMTRLPEGLSNVMLRTLARAPADRPATCEELIQLLSPFREESPESTQKRLAALVVEAFSATLPQDLLHDKTPAVGALSASLASLDPEATPVVLDPSSLASPRTTDVPALDYQVHADRGERFGPWPYARVVEAVATGQFGPEDKVSVGGGAFRRLAEVGELARHLPPLSTITPTTQQRSTSTIHSSETFSLEQGGIIRALARAILRNDTGLLLCQLGSVRKEIYLKDGAPAFVTSNLAGELLGEFLVSRGVISRGELDMALAVMPRFEGRLGDTLAALGLVEPVHLFQHIAGQVREKLLELFLWTGGTANLYHGVAPPSSGFPLGLDPWRILDEGIHRRIAQGLEEERLRNSGQRRLVAVDPPPKELRGAVLAEDAQKILDALRVPCTLAQLSGLLAETMEDRERPVRTVVLLLHLDAIQWMA